MRKTHSQLLAETMEKVRKREETKAELAERIRQIEEKKGTKKKKTIKEAKIIGYLGEAPKKKGNFYEVVTQIKEREESQKESNDLKLDAKELLK